MLLEGKQMEAYVKYNLFDKGQNNTYNKKHPFVADKLFYNDQLDVYICPMGQQMHYIGDTTKKLLLDSTRYTEATRLKIALTVR